MFHHVSRPDAAIGDLRFLRTRHRHFAHEEISPQDSVKGQSVCVAIFTLGGSLGNFLGGQLIEKSSVHTMTLAAALFAILGAVIVVLVLCRPVRKKSVV